MSVSSLRTGTVWRKPMEITQLLSRVSLPGTQLAGKLEWQHLGRWCRAGNIWLASGVSYGNVGEEGSEIVMASPITENDNYPPDPCVRATTVILGLSPWEKSANRIAALYALLMWTYSTKTGCILFFQWRLPGRDRSSNVYTVISNSALSPPLLPFLTETLKYQGNLLLKSSVSLESAIMFSSKSQPECNI